MNTKIWFLLLAAGALSCAGCATETAKQIQGLELQAQHAVEKTSGKPRKDWGPAETEEYNDLFLEALQQVKPRDYVRLNATTGQLEAPGRAQQLQGFELQAQHMVEKTSGKPRKDWGPAETEEYNDLFLEALQQVKPRDYVRLNATTGQLEAPGLFRLPLSTNDAARSQPVTEYGNGIQNVSRVGQ